MSHRRIAAWWIGLAVLAGSGCGGTGDATAGGCGPVTDPIVENQEFTPAEAQRGGAIRHVTLNPHGDMPVEAPDGFPQLAELDGLPLQLVDSASDAVSVVYYFYHEPVVDLLYSEFTAGGGIQLAQEGVEGFGSITDAVAGQLWSLGLWDHVVQVEIGPHIGLLNWGDPDRGGTRAHHLSWSDGEHNFSLIADRTAEHLLTLGRSLVCTG